MNGRGTPRGAIHIERRRTLYGERLYERVRCTNFGLDQVMLPLVFEYGADFRDMFEVRGMRRARRGLPLPPQLLGRHVLFAYEGLDDIVRISTVTFSEPPWRMDEGRAEFMFTLAPGERIDLFVEAGAGQGEPPSRERFRKALADARRAIRRRERRGALLRSSDDAHSAWFEQSRADLGLLVSDLPSGPYPFAGIPWFSTPFGRDGLLTAWEVLWLDPALAKGVLTYLASRQATEVSAFQDSQPGKIMHETRGGEMAAMKEIPFGLYYGGVDTTPLFVALAGAYLTRTDDVALIGALWPALKRAIEWVEGLGDSNGDGLIDYKRGADTGLANQGWKDSEDSVFHADGRFPVGPIALVEVQGYVYAAFQAMAQMAERGWAKPVRSAGTPAPRRCGGGWSSASGWRRPASTASPSMAPARSARRTPPTSAICCSRGCRHRTGRRGSRAGCSPMRSTAAGGCARWPPAPAASIR